LIPETLVTRAFEALRGNFCQSTRERAPIALPTDRRAKIVVPESTEFNVNDEAYKQGGVPAISDAQLKRAARGL
jgi:hypothetical protein